MKTIVSVQEVSELDIKPPAALAKWRELVAADLAERFADRSDWVSADWPIAGDVRPAFERLGVNYVESLACGSLFADKRPSEEAIRAWYRESRSARFWREELLSVSQATREEKITRPRADWISDGIAEYIPRAQSLVDLSTHGRALLDLVVDEHPGLRRVIAAGMTADLEGEFRGPTEVRPARVSELPDLGPADVVVAIDTLDRAADLNGWLASVERLVAPGGVLFLTVAAASGFEIQTLWSNSPSILPPDKINLPSVDALKKFFPEPAWEFLELSTPGMFDVDLVLREMERNPDADWSRPVRSLVRGVDEAGRRAFVELLQSLRLASFARAVLRRGR